jgi:hypothetical protein
MRTSRQCTCAAQRSRQWKEVMRCVNKSELGNFSHQVEQEKGREAETEWENGKSLASPH